jgi:hypothetical protein
VFAEVSAYSNKRIARPYANFQIGYGMYSSDNSGYVREAGGLYFSPGIGALNQIQGSIWL